MFNQAREEFSGLVLDKNSLALVGTALYWAEGAKSRNAFSFCNSDPDMVLLFLRWLREVLRVPDSLLKARVNAYLNKDMTYEKIRAYWSNLTGIPEEKFTKPTLRPAEDSSGFRKNRLPYGIITILVCKNQPYRAKLAALVQLLGKDFSFVENA